MSFRLAQTLLEAHGLEPMPRERERDAVLPRVDQVLLGREDAPLVVALLERAGVSATRVSPVLAGAGRLDVAGGTSGPHDWRGRALELGMLLARPGHGAAEVLHRERLAAPGRLALCAGMHPGCGALGMLAIEADALEVAAVLVGGPLTLRSPRVWSVELRGVLPPGVGGTDLALAVLSRLGESDAAADVVEFGGADCGALAMTERSSAAWLLAEAGRAVLFPSDDATRAELAALGRDQDWRRLEPVMDGEEPSWSLSLGLLEPVVAPAGEMTAARPVRSWEETAVARVMLGPAATLGDLSRLAVRLEGRHVAEQTECTVVVGSRLLLDRAAAAGVVERLAAAGVRVVEGEPSSHVAGAGVGLCCGMPLEAVVTGRGQWLVAGLETVAAAALAGRISPPGADEGAIEVLPALDRSSDLEPWLPPAGAAAPPRVTPARARHAGMRCRGEVLAVLGDDVETRALLPPGARLDELRGRLRALAGALLAGIEPDFAERTQQRGGGCVVAGAGFGRGGSAAAAAACLAEAGVWGVLARSYAPGAARTLVDAGVMPLLVAGMDARIERGDEIELPGVPDALEPGRALTARNLTRAGQVALRHDLSAREIAILRAGGLTAHVTGAGHPAGGG